MLERVSHAGAGHRKKLEEVARAWARGDLQAQTDHDTARAEHEEAAAAIGLQIEWPTPAADTQAAIYLWPQNVEAWNLFMACGGQWRLDASGARVALDYAAVEIVMARLRIRPKRRRQRWHELVLMESASLDEWRKRAEVEAVRT